MADQVTYSGTLKGSDGSTLQIGSITVIPATPVPVPDPIPLPPPAGTGRVRLLWHHGWAGPSIDTWPVDVASGITAVGLVMAQSAAAGTGRLTDPPGITKAQALRLQSAGIDVLAGIGGSGDGGIDIRTSQQVQQALGSIGGMRDRLAITGVILDLEGAPGSGWSPGAMTDLGHALIAAGLKVGIWSALYGGRIEGWGQVARALGDGLHSWQRGFYDFPEAGDTRLTGIVTGDLAAMRGYVAREDQLVASFMPTPPEGGYPNSSPTTVLAAAYRAGRGKYPAAGWSVWEDRIDAGRGWPATRGLAVS